MSIEGGPSGAIGTAALGSVGAVGVASAGPSVTGTSMSAEFGASGIGFDNGSPTFSGLGRSDSSLGSFSINEGPQGPVSFTNSTDLFAETKSFSAPAFSVPEGPVRGDIFNQTEIIAQSLTQELPSNPEPVSVFDNTSPFQITMPVKESHVYAPEPMTGSVLDQSEINIEDVLESHLGVSPETVTQAVEDFKTHDPLVYEQLKSDLKSVDVILDLVDKVEAEEQIMESISNQAIETAVERSGLIEVIEATQTVQDEEEFVTELETAPEQNVQKDLDAIVEKDDQKPLSQDSPQDSFVRDEAANKVRIESRYAAAEEELEIADGEVVEGGDIIARVSKTESEQSGLAKKIGVEDGSISPADEIIKKGRVENIQEADNLIYKAIKDNTGVTEGVSGPRATEEEKIKVAGKNLTKAA